MNENTIKEKAINVFNKYMRGNVQNPFLVQARDESLKEQAELLKIEKYEYCKEMLNLQTNEIFSKLNNLKIGDMMPLGHNEDFKDIKKRYIK